MKSTGIVRKVDDLGRIVLPVELRRLLELDDRAEVEIYTEGDTVVLKKHRPSCIFCGGKDDLRDFRGSSICATCRQELSKE